MRQDPAEKIDSISSQRATCPKCNDKMEEGFVADRGDSNAVSPSQWVQGQPERTFLLGTKTRGKVQFQIATYRCQRCGYLESYAKY
jgi:ribosomal protein S27AE